MADPFVGEIRAVAFNFVPKGWAVCDGQLLPLSQNTALFSLLGTYYGGDGRSNFGLPDLRDASPLHVGMNQPGPGLSVYYLGQAGGDAGVALTQNEMPAHTHALFAQDEIGTVTNPDGAALATPRYGRTVEKSYAATASLVSSTNIATAGSNTPHNNRPPYLVLKYIIALQGVFPQRP